MNNSYLAHHGIKGMHWGVITKDKTSSSGGKTKKNKYLNSDGSLTKAGKKMQAKAYKIKAKEANNEMDQSARSYTDLHSNVSMLNEFRQQNPNFYSHGLNASSAKYGNEFVDHYRKASVSATLANCVKENTLKPGKDYVVKHGKMKLNSDFGNKISKKVSKEAVTILDKTYPDAMNYIRKLNEAYDL